MEILGKPHFVVSGRILFFRVFLFWSSTPLQSISFDSRTISTMIVLDPNTHTLRDTADNNDHVIHVHILWS